MQNSFPDWLIEANAKALDDQTHERGVDIIFSKINSMLKKGKFSEINKILEDIVCDEMAVITLLAVLTITYAAKSRLPSRLAFYDRVEKSIIDRGEMEDGLLDGLRD